MGMIEAIKKECSLKNIKSWLINFWKENRSSLIAFVLFVSLFYAIGCNLSWLENTKLFNVSKSLYTAIETNCKLNWWIVLLFLCLAGFIIYRILRDRDIRPWKGLLTAALMIVLYHSRQQFGFVNLKIKDSNLFDYSQLWLCLLAVLCVLYCVKVISIIWKKLQNAEKNKEPDNPGFITDIVDIDKSVDENFNSYSKTLVNRLLNTDLSKKSFAVGITGGWGSGKSTFLKTLKDGENGFKDKVEIVEFNPWMCQSPDQVISDFFNALREQLSSRHSRLSRPIKEYAQVLNTVAASTPFESFTKISSFWPNDKSLQKKKEHLSQQLQKMEKPVVVFIDDLDRLESREIFEVLRLVRNTGDLCNIIYIVAYDKDYLISALSKKNEIFNSSDYIEKIFPLELHLPKIENSYLSTVFLQCFDMQRTIHSGRTSFYSDRFDYGLKKAMLDFRELMPRILFNYRRVRNFSRRFALIIELYDIKKLLNTIVIRDLLGIELLEIHDKSVFERLSREPGTILDEFSDRYYYSDDNKDKLLSYSNSSLEDHLDITMQLLQRLFGEEETTEYIDGPVPLSSIRDKSNFNTYFLFRLPKDILTEQEFNTIFDKEADIQELVKGWTKDKSPNSVITRFDRIGSHLKTLEEQKAYLTGVLTMFEYKNIMANYKSSDFRKLLEERRFSNISEDELMDTLISWFKEMGDCIKKSRWLNALYQKSGKAQQNNKKIDNDKIEELLREYMSSFLQKKTDLDIKGFLMMDIDLFLLLNNCCVCRAYDEKKDLETWDNIAFDIVLDHFSRMEKKYSKQELNEAVDEMIKNRIASSSRTDSDDETVDSESLAKERKWILSHCFGSDYEKKLEELIDKCSLQPDEKQENVNLE